MCKCGHNKGQHLWGELGMSCTACSCINFEQTHTAYHMCGCGHSGLCHTFVGTGPCVVSGCTCKKYIFDRWQGGR